MTGASSGIGRQVAISCSAMGATVVISGRDEKRLNETFTSLEGQGHSQFTADLVDEKQRDALVDALPNIDGVVHSAGIVSPVPIKFIAEKHIHSIMAVNFDSAVLMIARMLKNKKLNEKTSLVFFSSVSVNYPYTGGALYSASKGAIEAYSKSLALEIYPKKMRSNVIIPAMVKTPLYEETINQGMYRNVEEYESKYPLGIGKPEDIANAAIYLLSEASSWVTGTTLLLDGGFTIGK